MIELKETSAVGQLRLPTLTGCTLRALTPARITSIAPYPGQVEAMRARLGGFPAPGEVVTLQGIDLVWAGREQALAFGEGLPEGLENCASLNDQSDGWAGAMLAGEDAQAVLARLVAMELRDLPVPSSARTLLGHLPLLLVKERETEFQLWTYRSMAGSIINELDHAMRSVAARRAVT